jgi:hypothetical protein
LSIVKTQTLISAKKFSNPNLTNLNDILFLFISVFVNCQDTNLDISEKVFESEFNKLYGSAQDEAKAAAALADAEKQVLLHF